MRLPINKTYSSQVALLTIACFLHALVGCERAPASGTVFIRVTDPAGRITEKSFYARGVRHQREGFGGSVDCTGRGIDRSGADPERGIRELEAGERQSAGAHDGG